MPYDEIEVDLRSVKHVMKPMGSSDGLRVAFMIVDWFGACRVDLSLWDRDHTLIL